MTDVLYEFLLHAIHFEQFSVRRFRLFIGLDRFVVETAVFKQKGELIGERPEDAEISALYSWRDFLIPRKTNPRSCPAKTRGINSSDSSCAKIAASGCWHAASSGFLAISARDKPCRYRLKFSLRNCSAAPATALRPSAAIPSPANT